MIQPFETGSAVERPLIVNVRLDQVLFVVLLAVIFGIRIVDLSYNSLFVDAAIYATVGRAVLAGATNQSALGWMYGSHLSRAARCAPFCATFSRRSRC